MLVTLICFIGMNVRRCSQKRLCMKTPVHGIKTLEALLRPAGLSLHYRTDIDGIIDAC